MAQYPQPQAMSVVVQQPAQVVLAQPEKHPSSRYSAAFMGVGITQIVAGIGVSVVLGLADVRYIFSGLLYIATGGVAVGTAVTASRCNVIAGMVLSILSAISACSSTIAFAMISYYIASGISLYIYTNGALFTALWVFCAVEAVASIVHSAFCCKGTCCYSPQQGAVIMTQPQVINAGYSNPMATPGYDQTMYEDHPIQDPQKQLL